MYSVCVYAICKDEENFVDRWMDSMSEADRVVVLDTGSTDKTVEKLRARGAEVTQEQITPWRFDTARNRSLELVPEDTDICVCTDLDEILCPGWRACLEKAWRPGAGQAVYHYVWGFNPDGSDGTAFWYEKVHARHGYRWTHPVHEVLQWAGPGTAGEKVTVEGMRLEHHPDPTKSRGQYLPLLELSVQEDPDDDRNMHYLGREYMFYGQWDACIATLQRHLSLPTAVWADERAASMRFIARAYCNKGVPGEAWRWYTRAIAEAPHLREPWVELARFLYEREDWDGVLYCTEHALQIVERPETYICEAESWGSLPHDLRAVALFQTGRLRQAWEEARRALALEPGNERLQKNVSILEQMI